MYLGVVTGTVVAERKAAGLEGQKLLLVQPVDDTGRSTGDVQVAVDTVQAGVGDRVYLVGSREAALALTPWFVPVDAAIVGIVDDVYTPERAAAPPAEASPVPTGATPAAEGKPDGDRAAAPPRRPMASVPPGAGK
ncbi:MAG TPA: EutN/CcmL family microcompartment protein [Kofleriaceae bacterium]|nr:EutN/CcmL family microcompartment protein [Kofleriaceae bacterium]